jgi:hypothetical protein
MKMIFIFHLQDTSSQFSPGSLLITDHCDVRHAARPSSGTPKRLTGEFIGTLVGMAYRNVLGLAA